MKNNFVAKNLHKTCKPSVVPQKQRNLKSEATLRAAREDALNELVDSETVDIDGMSWDERDTFDWQEACEHPLSCVGCSSISIEYEEDGK